MNALFAAPLGLAAALAGSLTDATAEAAQPPRPEPLQPPAVALLAPDVLAPDLPAPDLPAPDLPAPDLLAPDLPAPDLLAPEVMEVTARLQASDPAKICDDKCQVVALTEATLPGTGAADILSVVLEPEQHGLIIPNDDGTAALTFRVIPSKIARGEGLVATAKF